MENKIRHLGVIMDGNRRWARKHAMKSVLEGHRRGTDRMLDMCEWCVKYGIGYLTVYAFSTENWKRSAEEVEGLFKLIDEYFKREINRCIANGIRVKIIGNRDMISEHSMETIRRLESMTEKCDKLILRIALSYGGRDEIVRGVRTISEQVRDGKLLCKDIDEDVFQSYTDSDGIPDMDVVIRTGGQKRLSNFCPWLTVYSELYFTDTLWPDFSEKMLKKIIKWYEKVKINNGK